MGRACSEARVVGGRLAEVLRFMFIDSHAHLEMPQFEEDLPQVLSRARDCGVEAIISCGTSIRHSKRAIQIAETYPEVFATVGIHPHDARECTPAALRQLRKLAAHPRVVALGEMGLDFYRNLSPPEAQIQAFRDQIRLARELGKPIVVHDRDAHSHILRVLREERAQETGGVIHCFSGDSVMAKDCLEMGFYLSIPGSVTFKNSAKLRNVILQTPVDHLLLETDSPFLAPVPFRGKRNEPCHIRYTAERVARVLKIPLESLSQQIVRNTRMLFGLPMSDGRHGGVERSL
jgi:TatD DNase family protein